LAVTSQLLDKFKKAEKIQFEKQKKRNKKKDEK
jgi:hypothetical protein